MLWRNVIKMPNGAIKKPLFRSIIVIMILMLSYLVFEIFSKNLSDDNIHEYCSSSTNEKDNKKMSNSDWNKIYVKCLKKHGLEGDV